MHNNISYWHYLKRMLNTKIKYLLALKRISCKLFNLVYVDCLVSDKILLFG